MTKEEVLEIYNQLGHAKIQTIKEIRDRTGCNLKQAKDLIDSALEGFDPAPTQIKQEIPIKKIIQTKNNQDFIRSDHEQDYIREDRKWWHIFKK